MDAIIQRQDHCETDDRAREAATARTPARAETPRHCVRARLNGLPCLVSVTDDLALNGQVAVAPVAGEKAPLPPKGRRATLELVSESDAPDESAFVEPIEITLAAANPRSGRFTARVLALSEDQERLLCAQSA
ncbi:hypothetical protein [Roseospira navarrensis]|uniref:PilZ domain-containing protein n=1 Tax=Roseospira navarrensis TaxID=140058 RepID=A0A7X2D3F9_9PROT|nr:hypothetical protein [Roseospira navarrensis]MQX35557.1 hypothetical protein [Roseospira navarrensis]